MNNWMLGVDIALPGKTVEVKNRGKGTVLRLGDPSNKSAHYFIHLKPKKSHKPEWFSKDEVEVYP